MTRVLLEALVEAINGMDTIDIKFSFANDGDGRMDFMGLQLRDEGVKVLERVLDRFADGISEHSTSYPLLAIAKRYDVLYREVLALADYYFPCVGRGDVHLRNKEIAYAMLDARFGTGPSEERQRFLTEVNDAMAVRRS